MTKAVDFFCQKCGKKLEKVRRYLGFDLFTGKKAYEHWYECPDRKWWNGHTKHERHDLGDKINWIEYE